MPNLRTFNLQLGYVESTLLSTLTVVHVDGFDEVEEAMEFLRRSALSWLRNTRSQEGCCRAFVHVDGYRFCPKCGTDLDNARDPEPVDVRQFFYDLLSQTVDDAAPLLEFFEEKEGWSFHGGATPDAWVRGVGAWMGREDTEDRPFMEWTLADGSEGSTYD